MDEPADAGTNEVAPTVIDILLVVDAAAILAAHGTPSLTFEAPTRIAPEFYFLTASAIHVRAGQATADLRILASAASVLNWRSLCLSGRGTRLIVTDVIVPDRLEGGGEIVGPPRHMMRMALRPRPHVGVRPPMEPPRYTLVEARSLAVTMQVRGHGRMAPRLRFYLTEQDDDGQPQLAGVFECSVSLTLL